MEKNNLDIRCVKLMLNDKRAIGSWNKDNYTYDEVKDYHGLGIIPPKGIQVVDVDDKATMKAVDNILKSLNINTLTLITDKGKHYWFKSNKETSGSAMSTTLSTLKVDYRDSRNYLAIKKNNLKRIWNNMDVYTYGVDYIQLDMLADLPLFLQKSDRKLEPAINLGDGDGRNEYFMKNYILPVIQQGHNKDIRELMDIINDYIFMEPLPSYELDGLLKDNNYRENVKVKKHNDNDNEKKTSIDDKKYNDKLEKAKMIKDNIDIKYHDNFFWNRCEKTGGFIQLIRNSQLWVLNIEKVLLKSGITHREDILTQLKILSIQEPTDYGKDTVNLKDGYFDYNKNKLIPYGKDDFPTKAYDIIYDKDAYNKDVDNYLNSVSMGDKKFRMLLTQIVAYVLFDKENKNATSFFMVGDGNNGKSVFSEALKRLLGDENVSSEKISDLNKSFNIGIYNKVLNIADDEENTAIKNAGTLKSIISGSSIKIEAKYQDSFSWKPNLKLIFNTNKIPLAIGESTSGWFRRFIHIPWKYKVTAKTEIFDLDERLSTQEAKSYWFKLAVEGHKEMKRLKTIKSKHKFTLPDAVIKLTEGNKIKQNHFLRFVSEKFNDVFEGASHKKKDGRGVLYVSFILQQYNKWCRLNGFSDKINIDNFETLIINAHDTHPELGIEFKHNYQLTNGKRIKAVLIKDRMSKGDQIAKGIKPKNLIEYEPNTF